VRRDTQVQPDAPAPAALHQPGDSAAGSPMIVDRCYLYEGSSDPRCLPGSRAGCL